MVRLPHSTSMRTPSSHPAEQVQDDLPSKSRPPILTKCGEIQGPPGQVRGQGHAKTARTPLSADQEQVHGQVRDSRLRLESPAAKLSAPCQSNSVAQFRTFAPARQVHASRLRLRCTGTTRHKRKPASCVARSFRHFTFVPVATSPLDLLSKSSGRLGRLPEVHRADGCGQITRNRPASPAWPPLRSKKLARHFLSVPFLPPRSPPGAGYTSRINHYLRSAS